MKKIFLSLLAVVAALVSCTKFAEDDAIVYDSTTAPVIELKAVNDSTLSLTVTAGDKTGFYSYALAAGEIKTVEASSLLSKPASTGKLAYGVVNFSNNPTISVTVKKLIPNTVYSAYAVAASTKGILTDVASASVSTTDGTSPVLSGAKTASTDSTLTYTISFDDPVSLGTGKVKATFFAINATPVNGVLPEYKTITVAPENISVSGKNLIVSLPVSSSIPGAYVAITYDAGTVVNGLSEVCAAYSNKTIGFDSKGNLSTKGIFGRYKTKNFDLTLPEGWAADTVVLFSSWKTLAMECLSSSKYPLAKKTGEASVKIACVDANGRTVSYNASNFGIKSEKTIVVGLGENPGYGIAVSYTIAADSFEDLFGNSSNVFTSKNNYYSSYGYTLADVIGTYSVDCTSAYSGYDELASAFVIAKSDDASKGNIMFTTIFGSKCVKDATSGYVYATFDVDGGTITIPDWQPYGTISENVNSVKTVIGYLYLAVNNADQVVLKVPAPGTLAGPDVSFGYYGDVLASYESQFKASDEGWWNRFTAINGTRK